MSHKVSVLFVCLGNICRSPTAHGIFEKRLRDRNLQDQILVDSAGTGDWHLGKAPDPRAQSYAQNRGYDISHLRARQIEPSDFELFDYILAMDNQNLANIRSMQPADYRGHVSLFLDFLDEEEGREVPDPYYGGAQGFELVVDMVERACDNLLENIRSRHPGIAP
ncbi:MAG: low molecular weight protein-tyrosine-phosphatase [Pseudomonadales bacterium]